MNIRTTILLAATSLALAACGSGGSSSTPPVTTPLPTTTPSFNYPSAVSLIAVADYTGASVETFPASATGNAGPSTVVSGAATGFSKPNSIAFDSNGRMYVTDGTSTIKIYTSASTGNLAPVSTITSSSNSFSSVAVDSSNDVYATDCGAKTIVEFAVGSSGASAPVKTIGGASTTLACPYNVALDAAGRVLVVDSIGGGASNVDVFAAGASGNVAPVQTINGMNVGFPSFTTIGLAAAPDGSIYATLANNSIGKFAPTSTGNTAAVATIGGALTTMANSPRALAFDAAGTLYVVESGAIDVFAPGASGNVAPIRKITGASTGFTNLFGIAIH